MSTPRIVIGNIGGGRFGMKCSLPGVNATTADDNDPTLFSFCSAWSNMMRIGASGIAFVAAPTGNFYTSTYIVHGFGYTPFMELRGREDTTNTMFAEKSVSDYHSGAGTTSSQRYVGVADTNGCAVYIAPWSKIAFSGDTPFRQMLGPGTVSFVWYAYADPAP